MDIYRQILELELELNGVADLEEQVQIAKELEALRTELQAQEQD